MRVCVTKEDIKNAQSTRDRCPIARAIHRMGFFRARVSVCFIALDGEFAGLSMRRLPKKARDFVFLFDRGEEVKPFTFHLR